MSPKKLVIGIVACLLSFFVKAQVVDTVCPGEYDVRYYVVQNPGARYQWTVDGGIISSGNGTNEIHVNWGKKGGLYKISSVEINALGCEADPSISYVWIKEFSPDLMYPNKACKNDTVELEVSGASTVLWDTRDTGFTKKLRLISDTIGWVIVTNNVCTQSLDTLYYMIRLGSSPTAIFTPDTGTYLKNQAVNIIYKGSTSDQLHWQIRKQNIYNSNQHSFTVYLDDTGKTEINLLAVSVDGCIDSSNRWVYVVEENLYAPNAFTPNSDGLNDVYRSVHIGIKNYELRIMNRWGEILFETTDKNHGWDGTYRGEPVQADSYMYFMYGRGYTGKEYFLKGSLDLLR